MERAGRFQGRLDSALTERGVRQAADMGRLLANTIGQGQVDGFFASPLGRTRRTADIVRTFGTYPATVWDSRLAEISLGSWTG